MSPRAWPSYHFRPHPIYTVAKAALHAYARLVRVQLADTHVQVIELAPPGTETRLFLGESARETQGQKALGVTTACHPCANEY